MNTYHRRGAKRGISSIFVLAVFLVVLWIGAAQFVFAIRHPWATDTERFLHFIDALRFRQLTYEEMRPRVSDGLRPKMSLSTHYHSKSIQTRDVVETGTPPPLDLTPGWRDVRVVTTSGGFVTYQGPNPYVWTPDFPEDTHVIASDGSGRNFYVTKRTPTPCPPRRTQAQIDADMERSFQAFLKRLASLGIEVDDSDMQLARACHYAGQSAGLTQALQLVTP